MERRRRTWRLRCVVRALCVGSAVLALHSLSPPAWSQNAGNRGKQPTPAEQAEAQQRYKRALELYDEGSYDAAQLELRRAYELYPSYRLLYNIGLVSMQLRDYVRAIAFFEQYLAEGGTAIPTERKDEVTGLIAQLQPRIARLTVVVDLPGADIAINDMPVGKSPLKEPLRVNSGRVKVTATAARRIPVTRVLELAGGDATSVRINLPSAGLPAVPMHRPTPGLVYVFGGAAIVGAGAFAGFAILGKTNQSKLKDECAPFCSDSDVGDVKTPFLVADISLGVSVLSLATAGILYLTRPQKPIEGGAPKTTGTIVFDQSGASLSYRHVF